MLFFFLFCTREFLKKINEMEEERGAMMPKKLAPVFLFIFATVSPVDYTRTYRDTNIE